MGILCCLDIYIAILYIIDASPGATNKKSGFISSIHLFKFRFFHLAKVQTTSRAHIASPSNFSLGRLKLAFSILSTGLTVCPNFLKFNTLFKASLSVIRK